MQVILLHYSGLLSFLVTHTYKHMLIRVDIAKRDPTSLNLTPSYRTQPHLTRRLDSHLISLLLLLLLAPTFDPLLWLRSTILGRLLLSAVLWNPEDPVEENGCRDVENTVCPKDTEVPPSVSVVETETRQERVGVPEGTEFTVGSSGRVPQVTACGGDVWCHVGLAALSVCWFECEVFDG
jgi:hypothetical protein